MIFKFPFRFFWTAKMASRRRSSKVVMPKAAPMDTKKAMIILGFPLNQSFEDTELPGTTDRATLFVILRHFNTSYCLLYYLRYLLRAIQIIRPIWMPYALPNTPKKQHFVIRVRWMTNINQTCSSFTYMLRSWQKDGDII